MTLLVPGAMGHVGFEIVRQAAARGLASVARSADEVAVDACIHAARPGRGARWTWVPPSAPRGWRYRVIARTSP